jgi:hypothetical protein
MNHFHFPYEPFTAAHTLFFYADNATQGQRALGPVVIDRTSLTSTCTVIIEPASPRAPQSLPITNSPPIGPTDSATSTRTVMVEASNSTPAAPPTPDATTTQATSTRTVSRVCARRTRPAPSYVGAIRSSTHGTMATGVTFY